MNASIRNFLALLVLTMAASAARGADIDRTAVDVKTPSDIQWIRNKAGTNESVVLFGDPAKPGRLTSFASNGCPAT